MQLQNMTARMFKGRFKKAVGEKFYEGLGIRIQDHKINGVFSEATGHIYNPSTGIYIYINLKPINPYGYMFRYAASYDDYSSNRPLKGMPVTITRNRWCKNEQYMYTMLEKMLKEYVP